MNDPIADMLIRIKNGYQARKNLVEVPHSKVKEKIAKILVNEGYLKNSKLKTQNLKLKMLELELKYEKKKPAVIGMRRISKPGVRIYRQKSQIPKVKIGPGITLVSTPKGLMIDKEARKSGLGGEIIGQIW